MIPGVYAERANQTAISGWVKSARSRFRQRKYGDNRILAAHAMHAARYLKATGEKWVSKSAFENWFWKQGGAELC